MLIHVNTDDVPCVVKPAANDLTSWVTGDLIGRLKSSSDGPVHSAATVLEQSHPVMNPWSEPFSCLFVPVRNKHWKLSGNPDHISLLFFIRLSVYKAGGAFTWRGTQQYIHHPPHRQLHVSSSVCTVCLSPQLTADSLNPCSQLLLWLFLTPACFIFYCTLITWVLCLFH